MKMRSPLRKLLVPIAVLIGATSASAVPVDLVVNGEFESPNGSGSHFTAFNPAVPGWSSNQGRMEFFNQGGVSSPSLGSDGLGTGQHHEIPWNPGGITTSDAMVIPAGLTEALLTFDAWPRSGVGVSFSVMGSVSGLIYSDILAPIPGNLWTAYTTPILNVLSGEDVTLRFESVGGGGSGAHIDDVQFLVEAAQVPESGSTFAAFAGASGLLLLWGRRSRRRRG